VIWTVPAAREQAPKVLASDGQSAEGQPPDLRRPRREAADDQALDAFAGTDGEAADGDAGKLASASGPHPPDHDSGDVLAGPDPESADADALEGLSRPGPQPADKDASDVLPGARAETADRDPEQVLARPDAGETEADALDALPGPDPQPADVDPDEIVPRADAQAAHVEADHAAGGAGPQEAQLNAADPASAWRQAEREAGDDRFLVVLARHPHRDVDARDALDPAVPEEAQAREGLRI
jgi:hypothetical protein